MKAALVTVCLPHLPLHPSCFLGYSAAILAGRYDLEVIDFNAEIYFKNRGKLKPLLETMDETQIISDALHVHPFYNRVDPRIDKHYAAIPWKKYPLVYVTPPTWFPMVPAEAVLRLSRAIKEVSPKTKIFFFGNSLGSWTSEGELKENGVQLVHLNDLFTTDATSKPVNYDLLPHPIYENRDKYLFDLLPFALKHGCSWGRCRFCALSKGWNSGYLERSAKAAIKELEVLIDRYNPKVLVCKDHALNGRNLTEFCGSFKLFKKTWCGESRADLSGKQIEALSKAGCRAIYFGLESGSDAVLRKINKGITSKQMSDFVKRLHSNGILPVPSVIVGTPGEQKVDFKKTIQFLADHRDYLNLVNVYPFTISPVSQFGCQKKHPRQDTPMRLFRFIHACTDLGLKVICGEQSIEYFVFKKMCTEHIAMP